MIDRCKKYLPTVTREARYHIGIDAPTHYFMGQIEVESKCQESITAFDGGMGLGQIMPETAKELHAQYAELQEFPFNPYDPRWNIRAMILYDRACYKSVLCKGWYYAFRGYNGGVGNINREIKVAGSCNEEEVERACKRKVIMLKSGAILDLCSVNISYPRKIFKSAEKYKT